MKISARAVVTSGCGICVCFWFVVAVVFSSLFGWSFSNWRSEVGVHKRGSTICNGIFQVVVGESEPNVYTISERALGWYFDACDADEVARMTLFDTNVTDASATTSVNPFDGVFRLTLVNENVAYGMVVGDTSLYGVPTNSHFEITCEYAYFSSDRMNPSTGDVVYRVTDARDRNGIYSTWSRMSCDGEYVDRKPMMTALVCSSGC